MVFCAFVGAALTLLGDSHRLSYPTRVYASTGFDPRFYARSRQVSRHTWLRRTFFGHKVDQFQCLSSTLQRPRPHFRTLTRAAAEIATVVEKPIQRGKSVNFLYATGLSKNFNGERDIFKDITVSINQGQKVALLGINGCGKSSLLKVLARREVPDEGRIDIRGAMSIGYLDQDPDLDNSHTVYQGLFSSDKEAMRAVGEYIDLLQLEESTKDDTIGKRLQALVQKIDSLGAWDLESRAKLVLAKLGITNLEQKIGTLSGGQKKRVALARVLIEEPDFLVLDEPTNHLDVQMCSWLEDFLKAQQNTVLLVTHDRSFLESVTDEILELDGGKLFSYKGNYSYFLEKKADRDADEEKEQAKIRNLLRKELAWVIKQPKARESKSKSRVEAFHKLSERGQAPAKPRRLELAIDSARLGGKVAVMDNVCKRFGDRLILENFSYEFRRGERLGIVGSNGVGKSTFLSILSGEEQPDSGKLDIGDNTVFGYYAQEGLQLREDMRVLDLVKEYGAGIKMADGSILTPAALLQLFLFSPAQQYAYVSSLSGGERKRLYLMTVLIKNPNFIIMDEPTNDLDLVTLQVLEEFLLQYCGCLIIVTHDRVFMNKLVDHLFIFEGEGTIVDFYGNYKEYEALRVSKEKEEKEKERRRRTTSDQSSSSPSPSASKVSRTQLSNKERYEYTRLEKEIEDLESKHARLEEKLMEEAATASHTELASMSAELGRLTDNINAKTERWLELAEMQEAFDTKRT